MAGLMKAVEKCSDLWNQIIDMSYSSKLKTLNKSGLFNKMNSTPSLKKLYLKGTTIAEGFEETIFEEIKSNLTLL